MKGLQKKRKGFTLIELVVVIVIIAILAAVALLSFGDFTKTARDSRIRQEHSELIAAGNMWRAAQSEPESTTPTYDEAIAYMEKDPLDGPHEINNNAQLVSELSTGETLVYEFETIP